MKQLFIINDGRKKKYGAKSISGYKKKLLLKAFELSIKTNNYYNSLYFGFECIASGYFNELWLIIITITSEYIHILNPDLPMIINEKYEYYKKLEKAIRKKKIDVLKMRNLLVIQKDFVYIIKNLVNSKKKHISHFIAQTYNNQPTNKITEKPVVTFKRFKQLLHTIINNKITYKGNTDILKDEFFNTLGKIMAIDCISTRNIAYPHHINIYHHDKSAVNKEMMSIFWNVVIKISKFNKNIMSPIVALYKMFNHKISNKLEKESYHIIHTILYFLYNIEDTKIVAINREDILRVRDFYNHIHTAMTSQRTREDFISIEDKSNKKKGSKSKPKSLIKRIADKNKKMIEFNLRNQKKIIPTKDIKMHAVIPQTNINQIIKDNEKSIAKPINPSDIVADLNHQERSLQKLEEDDIMMFHMVTGQQEEVEKQVVNIVINNGSFEEQISDMMNDALFDFEELPSIQDSLNKRAKIPQYTESRKNIRGIDKSYAKFNREVCNITKS